jgi:cobalamin biosynthesis protein CobC
MFSCAAGSEPLSHGGDLTAARRLFLDAPQPFLDLSTGINPDPYPLPDLPAELFARLPDSAALSALTAQAAKAYGAYTPDQVVAAPGTQILLPLLAGLVPPGRAAVLAPTYGEFARAAALAGHSVSAVGDLAAVMDCPLVFVANPNNPDGRLSNRDALLRLAGELGRRGGLLVVDEAFMDVGPRRASLAGNVASGAIVVLRSFGKFFGLAGLRLGFALAAPEIAARLSAALGPWAVSGPAMAVATAALADAPWIARTRTHLSEASQRLDAVLASAGLAVTGGTTLFRLVHSDRADFLFHHLGRAGILTRIFPDQPTWLRFGLPGGDDDWRRLQVALTGITTGR